MSTLKMYNFYILQLNGNTFIILSDLYLVKLQIIILIIWTRIFILVIYISVDALSNFMYRLVNNCIL